MPSRRSRVRVGEPEHPERVGQAEERGEERDEERDLKGAVAGGSLMARTSASTSGGSSVICSPSCGVAHHLGVVLERGGDLLLLRPGDDGALARCVKLNDSAASMMPPAMASPKDSPNEPAAEFTPAASLIRSSAIGARV